ncbi:DUF1707 and DUF4190 domain-containing protein [Glycomyces sp. A-F 0318]|uniref:DUF1707 and DUF4190 domain-containing protein n=1 Tax=Glycomyces amatae TaxID=2881355 RepID=UPI001E3EAF18|nr:DUF1707 and DUF4190 domain-containing protein [Glycomyces amatae]MCD0443877.1 DUF1707 and DUF4190 domain-containing protein [Glycomyces amatae]
MPQPDPGRMRISDDERAAVAAQLRDALEAGRLNLHEFDERSRDLYESQTYAEVGRLLEDLPAANLPVPPAPEPAPAPAEPEGSGNLMGHIALGMGVMSFVSFVPFTILAVVFGLIGIEKHRKGEADNRSFALAGLILGAVSVPVWILFFVLGASYWW